MGRVGTGATTTGQARVRDLLAGVPRSGRLLLLGVAIDALGVGLTLPFAVVYLREVRGIPLTTVGLLLSLPPIVALVLLGPIGLAIDRYGARRVQMVALTFTMVGQVALVAVRGPLSAAVGAGPERHRARGVLPGDPVAGRDGHPGRAPAAVLRHVVHAAQRRHRAGRCRLRACSWTCTGRGPSRLIYLADAASYLIPLLLLAFVLRGIGGPVTRDAVDEPERRRHRRTRQCCGTGCFAGSWP